MSLPSPLPLRCAGLLTVAAALAGCGPLPTEEEAPAALAQALYPAGPNEGVIIGNALSTEALVFNALTANWNVAPRLRDTPLRTSTFQGDAELARQLHDEATRQFFSYFVGCALAPDQPAVVYEDPFEAVPRTQHTFRGEAGLCPEWAAGPFPLSTACQERVSACLLARNNAFGQRVRISVRGEDAAWPGRFALLPRVAPDGYAPRAPRDTPPLPTVQPCTTPSEDPRRECGWRPDAIGTCTPGTSLTVGIGGSTPTKTLLRVCEGTSACTTTGATFLADSTSGGVAVFPPQVTFTCPSSSRFGVLAAPSSSSNLPGPVTVTVKSTKAFRYPAPESEVFAFAEGAFFGTLFDGSKSRMNVWVDAKGDTLYADPATGMTDLKPGVVPGSVYPRMYSCWAPTLEGEQARLHRRVCATPDGNCAANVLGACTTLAEAPAVCDTRDGSLVPGDMDFERCFGGKTLWMFPLTTYLEDRCAFALPGTQGC